MNIKEFNKLQELINNSKLRKVDIVYLQSTLTLTYMCPFIEAKLIEINNYFNLSFKATTYHKQAFESTGIIEDLQAEILPHKTNKNSCLVIFNKNLFLHLTKK